MQVLTEFGEIFLAAPVSDAEAMAHAFARYKIKWTVSRVP
jgi:hypothetical protein